MRVLEQRNKAPAPFGSGALVICRMFRDIVLSRKP